MHLHTAGGSGCAQVEAEEIAKLYSEAGYGAIAVTNHYMKSVFENYYPPLSDKERITRYISLYERLQKCCAPYKIKVFLGMELNPECMNTPLVAPAAEFLCYGMTPKFLYDYPRLYEYTQKELFELFSKKGIAMFQSHPFRGQCVRGDVKYMHGLEVFNGHPFHISNNDLSEALAKENNLKGISGSDFHQKGKTITGGIYIPESISTGAQLADYIINNDCRLIKGNTINET
jgi:tyrosine-protein phosphatase YwqE